MSFTRKKTNRGRIYKQALSACSLQNVTYKLSMVTSIHIYILKSGCNPESRYWICFISTIQFPMYSVIEFLNKEKYQNITYIWIELVLEYIEDPYNDVHNTELLTVTLNLDNSILCCNESKLRNIFHVSSETFDKKLIVDDLKFSIVEYK